MMENDVTGTAEETRVDDEKVMAEIRYDENGRKIKRQRRQQTSVATEMWDKRNNGNGVTGSHRKE